MEWPCEARGGKHAYLSDSPDIVQLFEQFDYFHEVRTQEHCSTLTEFFPKLILNQEFSRPSMRGFQDGFLAGTTIGLPPVLNFGRPELKKKVVAEAFSGKKILCLAISEAFAGSDVSGIKTFAKKTDDGKHWIINGTKKWITNGTSVSIISFRFFCSEVQDLGLLISMLFT